MNADPEVSSSDTVGDLAAKVGRVVGADRRVVAAYLFGSRARGDASPGSDVDLGVLFEQRAELRDVVLLESELEEAIGTSVDLVDLGSCRTFLAVEIIEGKRIYCADDLACDRFELYVLRKAGDLAAFEKARRDSVLRPSGSSR